jgi:hypothetical protein
MKASNWLFIAWLLAPKSFGDVNVREYGAIGDGISDDTDAIQRAIDRAQANPVYLPAGVYLCGALFVFSNSTLHGDGWQSVLLAKTNIKAHLISPYDRRHIPSVSNVSIRDLKLLGHSLAQNNGRRMTNITGCFHGIALLGASNSLVSGVWAEDFDGDGIYLGRNYSNPENAPAVNNLVQRCVVRKNVRNGMMISYGIGNIIQDSLFEENQIGMVTNSPKFYPQFYASAELDIEPNRYGTNYESAVGNIIQRNVFHDGHHIGIQITKAHANVSSNVIRNNVFIDNAHGQIHLNSPTATNNLFEGNIFLATATTSVPYHVRIARGSGNVLRNNRFLGGITPVRNSHAIVIDDSGSGKAVFRTVFANNFVDFSTSSGDGASIFFSKMVQDSLISSNVLIGAHFDIRGENNNIR